MLTLLHHPMSGPSRFIRLILHEYQLTVELQLENPWEKRTEFLLINPAQTLPVLSVNGNHHICEAMIISEYLDETCGVFQRNLTLFPTDPIERAETRRLLYWFLEKFDQEVAFPLINEIVLKRIMPVALGQNSPESSVLRQARQNLKQHLKYLEWLAYNRHWLAGEFFSYVDLAAAAELSTLDYIGEIDWDIYHIAKEWYTRVKSRPSFQTILKDKIQGLAPVTHYTNLDF
ncbi:glutathione S-transferase family protein [Bartonella sp. DGB1]|uniref:glutathione S-transferase family protein n=1 Tax=Bartonella sp. DGB1 TaxID=3239807 RepID=UPI0035267686